MQQQKYKFMLALFLFTQIQAKGAYIKYVGGEPEGFTNFSKKFS